MKMMDTIIEERGYAKQHASVWLIQLRSTAKKSTIVRLSSMANYFISAADGLDKPAAKSQLVGG